MHKVAFYNYIQSSAGYGPKPNPTEEQWETGKPFLSVLKELCPNVIVVFGYELWDHLPKIGEPGPNIEGIKPNQSWCYPTKNKDMALAAAVYGHSAWKFNSKKCPSIINELVSQS